MPENDAFWTTISSADAELTPGVIWAAWADVANWPQWNSDIEEVEVDGPFAVGSVITMKPRGQEPVQLEIAELTPGERFVDEAHVAGTRIRTTHRLDQIDSGRTRISYELEADGQLAAELGPAISADFSEVIAALIAYAALAC